MGSGWIRTAKFIGLLANLATTACFVLMTIYVTRVYRDDKLTQAAYITNYVASCILALIISAISFPFEELGINRFPTLKETERMMTFIFAFFYASMGIFLISDPVFARVLEREPSDDSVINAMYPTLVTVAIAQAAAFAGALAAAISFEKPKKEEAAQTGEEETED